MRLLLTFVILLVSFSIASAADHVALHVDFDADELNDWPDGSLPGDPDGDSLVFDDRLQGDDTTAHVVAAYAGLDSKPMLLDRWPNENISIYFYLAPEHSACESYTITWRACPANAFEYVYFTFRQSGGGLLTSLDYRVNGTMSYNTVLNTLPTTWTQDVAQEIAIQIDFDTDTSSLAIDGAPVPGSQGLPLRYGLPNGTLELMTMNVGGMNTTMMAVDDIHIVAHCGGVANATKSWGALKAEYR